MARDKGIELSFEELDAIVEENELNAEQSSQIHDDTLEDIDEQNTYRPKRGRYSKNKHESFLVYLTKKEKDRFKQMCRELDVPMSTKIRTLMSKAVANHEAKKRKAIKPKKG